MYELSVEREFCAAHALVISGVREVVHGHNFRVTLTVAGGELDRDGLLVDFHALEKVLDSVIAPMINADLNLHPAFARGVNPSAEQIAKMIAESVRDRLDEHARGRVRVLACRVTEAPGCSVTYRPKDQTERGGGGR